MHNLMENYLDQIQKLKQTIKEKENQISQLEKKSPYQSQLYMNYNKESFDKLLSQEQRKVVYTVLQSQLSEKNELKKQEMTRKEMDAQARLEDLRKQRQEALENQYKNISRAKGYKEDLDTQQHLKSYIKAEELYDIKSNIPRFNESPVQSISPNSIHMITRATFTKKNPKTIFYNPITGELQDMANYINGNLEIKKIHRQADSLFLPHFKSYNRVVPEFSDLKAFQQPKYTKSHPKVVPSFPITGNGSLNSSAYANDSRTASQKFFTNYGKIALRNQDRS